MKTILFICTGNTCRSPLAEAIAQHWLDSERGGGEGSRYLVASAGVAAMAGMPTSRESISCLRRLGIEYDGRSKPLTREMIEAADVVFAMTPGHLSAARGLVAGDEATKIRLIDPEHPIDDPIGMGQPAYDALAERFMTLIPRRLREILEDEDRAGIGSSRGEGG